jgi:hypothetical protein
MLEKTGMSVAVVRQAEEKVDTTEHRKQQGRQHQRTQQEHHVLQQQQGCLQQLNSHLPYNKLM